MDVLVAVSLNGKMEEKCSPRAWEITRRQRREFDGDVGFSNRKIVFVINTLGVGGAERVCVRLANGLAKFDWSVEVVVLKEVEDTLAVNLSQEVRLVCLCVSRARYASLRLARYLKKSKPSIVLTLNNEIVASVFFSQLFYNRKYQLVHRNVTTLSSVVYQAGGGLFNRIKYCFLKSILKRTDLLVNQCKAMAIDTESELGISSPYIYNPIRLNIPSIRDEGIRCATEYILCVGRIDTNKSFDLALKAFALLPEVFRNIELWIAGDGPSKPYLQHMAIEIGVGDRVKFLGFQSEIEVLYAGAKFVSLTSRYEGFPNTLIEAVSQGCPVVAVDCASGPAEIVHEGVNGFLVRERTAACLCEAFEKAMNTKWNRTSIAATAERFSETQVLEKWHRLLDYQVRVTDL